MDITYRTQLRDGEEFDNSTAIYFTSQSGIDRSLNLYINYIIVSDLSHIYIGSAFSYIAT